MILLTKLTKENDELYDCRRRSQTNKKEKKLLNLYLTDFK